MSVVNQDIPISQSLYFLINIYYFSPHLPLFRSSIFSVLRKMQEVSPMHSKIYLQEQYLTGLAPTIGLLPPYLRSFENLYYITWRTTHSLEKGFSLFAIFSTGVQKWRGVSFFSGIFPLRRLSDIFMGSLNPCLLIGYAWTEFIVSLNRHSHEPECLIHEEKKKFKISLV